MYKQGVKVDDIEQMTQLTLENLLMEKFRELQLAREAGDPDYFDAISQSIEILLKASPNAYNDFMTIKAEMDQELEQEYINIQNDASKAQDEIYRQHILDSRTAEADWIYRITYEESLIEVFQKNGLIGLFSSEAPHIEPIVEPQTQPEEQEEQEESSKKKKLKIGKPKLIRQQE